MHLNRFQKMDESYYETSDFDLNGKYLALQNNHRRLLGVTSALTEALEHTVRGDDFDLEQTLNECMKIYPELFGHDRKRPMKNKSRRRKYNTSVSEDTVDMGEDNMQTINAQLNFHLRKLYGETSNDQYVQLNHHRKHPVIYVESESESPDISQSKSLPEFTNKKSFLILTPEYLNHNKNDEKTKEKKIAKPRKESVSEINEYLVNHPESDTDLPIRISPVLNMNNEMNNNEVEISGMEDNIEIKALTTNDWPYEIIVKTIPQKSDSVDGKLLIHIKPDRSESAKAKKKQSHEKTKGNDEETQTSDTCIAFTKPSEGFNNIADIKNRDIHENFDNFENSLFKNLSPTSLHPKNDTMDKLQKLSTGLKVKTNEMQIMPALVENVQEKKLPYSEAQTSWFSGPNPPPNENKDLHNPVANSAAIEMYYKKLKETVAEASVNDRVTILQNLRLTLIHTLAKERSELVSSYVDNDILNINADVLLLDSLLPKEIVNGWDLILQQMILKFLNTMCSIWKGRDYLAKNTRTLSGLLDYFFNKSAIKPTTDAITLDMLMAIFNKLSTRQNQQVVLVISGVVEKILYNLIEGHNSMSPYRLRHSLGVLINSCTFDNGRNALEAMAMDIMNLIKSLLMRNDKVINPYCARLIYVLMANEVFHKCAKEIDLVSVLEKSINVSNKRLKLQLDVLKDVINKPKPHEFLYGTEENFLANIEAEMDELEEEVEIGDRPISTSKAEWHDKLNVKKSNNIDEKPIKTNKNVPHPRKNIPKYQPKKPNEVKSKSAITTKPPINNKKYTKPVKQEKAKMKPTMIPTPIQDRPNIDSLQNRRPRRHEIVESPDLSSKSYIVLDKNDSKNDDLVPEVLQKSPKSDIEDINDDKSFLVLDESEKSLHSSPESIVLADPMILPPDIVKSDEMLDKLAKERKLIRDETVLINVDGNPTVSVFVQQGRITDIEYDYCEDTKEIQSPIKYDNIFRGNRQSPYKSLLKEKSISFKQPTIDRKTMPKSDSQNVANSNESMISEPNYVDLDIEKI